MITAFVQRWNSQRDSYRPAGEVINPARYEVATIAKDAPAKQFIEEHHYSRSYPAARFRLGLYTGTRLVGVAVFSQPMNNRSVTSVFPNINPLEAVELGRFVLLDTVPANGETWFLARCFEVLKEKGVAGVVSFSDPQPRYDAQGKITFRGHIGTIYQAHNAAYLGRGTARTLRILPDGTVFSDRAIQKLRAGETGWEYAARTLVTQGAGVLPCYEARREWLGYWLPRLTTGLRHRGNLKYAWGLSKAMRAMMPPSLSYPKKVCIRLP